MMRERQILLHPGLLDLEGTSPKLAWLEDYLNDYPDKPILIFSRFTQWLELLQKMKSSMGLITGKSKPSERQLLIDAFQSGKLSVLGIQIDAGKEGLTLDRAETIIFTDVSRPMSDIIQARDRMIATTESKAAVPKEIIELVMEGTYDEVLFDNIDKDYAETTAINDYKKHISKGGRHGI
jgi:SNF2 family DNA or RNA helicase